MAFNGYYIKFIKGNTSWIFPMDKMMNDTADFSPYKVMDLDPYYDSTGLLHRNVVEHTSASMKWSTPPMSMTAKNNLMASVRSMYTNAKRRDLTVEYYNDETDAYDTADCYLVEPKFKPKEKNAITGEMLYNSIEFEVVKY